MKAYACFDIGGTAIKYGILNEHADILYANVTDSLAENGGVFIVESVKSLIKELSKRQTLSGICISTAGMVDIQKGSILYANESIPGYTGTDWVTIIEDEFHLPCSVENDVNCAALAEHKSGAAKGSSSTFCLAVGTGIGGALIFQERIYHGFSQSACEVGYMHMETSTFQDLGSTCALVRIVAQKTGTVYNGYQIFAMAKEKDRICVEAIAQLCDVLGKGIADICYVMNPETVVLTGGIMKEKEYLAKPLRQAVERYLLPAVAAKTKLVFAQYGNQAGMIGALYYHFIKFQL